MIRSSNHTTKFPNPLKLKRLSRFVDEYRRVGQIIIDTIWANGYDSFIPLKDQLNCPKYLDYNRFDVETDISPRTMSSLTTQICAALSASTKKRKKLLYTKSKLIDENIPTKSIDRLLTKYIIVKPDCRYMNPELSSKCSDIESGKSFDYFLRIKCIGKSYGHIKIPLKHTKMSLKWLKSGKPLTSYSLTTSSITLRFEIKPLRTTIGTKVIGVDQGMKDVATCSDSQTTPKTDAHGHSLEFIINKLSRKKRGSRAFEKTQSHRKNFINWSINQLNFNDAKEIRLEKIWNIGYKNRTSRKLSHWTNTLIRDKIIGKCEELEVPVIEQDSTYRSQRCFNCGLVRKANRKGKLYKCKKCGYEADADFNASLNHSIDLPDIDWRFRGKGHNLGKGFRWTPTGLFNLDGSELRVPVSNKQG